MFLALTLIHGWYDIFRCIFGYTNSLYMCLFSKWSPCAFLGVNGYRFNWTQYFLHESWINICDREGKVWTNIKLWNHNFTSTMTSIRRIIETELIKFKFRICLWTCLYLPPSLLETSASEVYSSNVLINPPRNPAPLQSPHNISFLPLH